MKSQKLVEWHTKLKSSAQHTEHGQIKEDKLEQIRSALVSTHAVLLVLVAIVLDHVLLPADGDDEIADAILLRFVLKSELEKT